MQVQAQEEFETHIEAIRSWLNENVIVYDDPKRLAMHHFVMKYEFLSGDFTLRVDGEDCPFEFHFNCLTATGKCTVHRPSFTSPLGAPASYAAVEIGDTLIDKMAAAITRLMPPIKPLGFDKTTGVELTTRSPFRDRLPPDYDPNAIREKMEQVVVEVEG